MLTFIDRNGPPEAMHCPAFLCDSCGKPVIGADGLVVWVIAGHVERRPILSNLWTVHKGRCDLALEAKLGDVHTCSRELDLFMEDLVHNTRTGFVEEPGAEYVAPHPSTWSLGTYERT